MKKLLAIPAAILFVLLLPVLVPLGFISYTHSKRRLKRAAEQSKCPTCGLILGKEALKSADERWHEYVSCLHRQNPGVRFRLLRRVHAICVSCGTSLQFLEQTQEFQITEPIGLSVESNHEI